MSRLRVAVAAALLLGSALLPACTSPDEEEELYLPTEAEAQASADATINPQNADDEFEKLQEEIESERH